MSDPRKKQAFPKFTDEQVRLLEEVRNSNRMAADRYAQQLRQMEAERMERDRRVYEAQRTIIDPAGFPMRALDDYFQRLAYMLGERDRVMAFRIDELRSDMITLKKQLGAILDRLFEMKVLPTGSIDPSRKQRQYRKD